ncbi:hypothetical protein CPB84DRAFT_692551 [Gymnopilus junonius]|uniref:Uncharacterized protein n=1 Tax=Gymnopilus junonius TaxID=109634 RepID=A0A9P5N7M6_GYMJU|nr:hypothetical protein CPB84DRAFT_692551 [Gymnopilus junonius]
MVLLVVTYHLNHLPPRTRDKNKEREVQRIDDLPDASFLPSFSSSQILTSTPKLPAKPPFASSSKAVIGITSSPPQRRLPTSLSPIQSPSSAATPHVALPVPFSSRHQDIWEAYACRYTHADPA